jgi:hypothetical protein
MWARPLGRHEELFGGLLLILGFALHSYRGSGVTIKAVGLVDGLLYGFRQALLGRLHQF